MKQQVAISQALGIACLWGIISVVGCAPSNMGQQEIRCVTVLNDLTKPKEIEHRVDEFIADARRLQHYNYIAYHFEGEKSYIWARSYLDEIGIADVYGPFDERGSLTKTTDQKHFDQVLNYLKRRYLTIQVLGKNGYETIWTVKKSGRSARLQNQ